MDGTERQIKVHVMQGRGFVWSADDAYVLREKYGIVGAMVGGLAAFKQQNAVRGLPLQLSPEEVTYLLKDVGVIELYSTDRHADSMRQGTSMVPGDSNPGNDSESDESSSDSQEEEGEGWQYALAHGTEFTIPSEVHVDDEALLEHVEWTYPSTDIDRQKYTIFRDLKRKKYCITAGSKFGADYLLYPGDPTQFHAQFCVRVAPIDVPLVPSSLAAACRGSFQARKHLLFASLDDDGEVLYTTFGQIGGFGTS
ncbi:hypothetical protein M9435_002996 [Picochlorum sp. BPE23]|nr:hypothetical protein M9435_002996 [Picochlorum sp. BPE23]